MSALGAKDKIDAQRIKIVRSLTIFCLVACAVLCAYGSYALVYYFEGRLQLIQYTSITDQVEAGALKSMNQKVLALNSQSQLLSMVCKDISNWPNCSVPMESFFNITDPMIESGDLRTLAFAPIITPDQVQEFEAFAYATFEEGGYPNMGISSFGKGISAINHTTGGRYHDTQGPDLNNEYQILTPVMQIGNLDENHAAVMFNLYSEAARIGAIDDMINCFAAGGRGLDCTSVTDIIHLVQDPVFRPAVLIIHPVVAANDVNTLVGLNYGVVNWDSVFGGLIPDSIDAISVILSSDDQSYTFELSNGKAIYKGQGDQHESIHHDKRHRFSIPYFRAGAVKYSVSLYPTDEYTSSYRTHLPIYAMVISLSIVVLTSLIFLVYDFQLRRNAKEKEIIMNTKRLFVRFVSHEIRTPMNIVHLGLSLLGKEMTDICSEFGDSISNETKKLMSLIQGWVQLTRDIEESSDAAISVLNDLINYDKISLGGMTIEVEPLNIWSTLFSTVHPFYVQSRQKDIKLSLTMDTKKESISEEERHRLSRLKLIGDPTKIVQVIRNLLSNAIKFTPEGGRVDVVATYIEGGLPAADLRRTEKDFNFQKTGSVLITVTDNGAGVSEEDQQKMFKEGIQFRANQLQAGGVRKKFKFKNLNRNIDANLLINQGSGLGLWISKGVVELHAGSLSMHSDGEGTGSTFTLEVPVGTMMSPFVEDMQCFENGTIAAEKDEGSMKAASRKFNNILCVDDSTTSRKITVRILERCGYHCYEAFDGENCLKVFNALTEEGVCIDVVLMDYEMPNMNGPTATAELISAGASCLVIGVTGNVLAEDRDIFINHGAKAVLAKPLSLELLESCLSKLANNSNSESNVSVELGARSAGKDLREGKSDNYTKVFADDNDDDELL